MESFLVLLTLLCSYSVLGEEKLFLAPMPGGQTVVASRAPGACSVRALWACLLLYRLLSKRSV